MDHLQQESCRLLSLSLTAAHSQTTATREGELTDSNDYKSQLISKLIEANRTLKLVVEGIIKVCIFENHLLSATQPIFISYLIFLTNFTPQGPSLHDNQTETVMTDKSTVPVSKSRDLSDKLYSSLLSALLADRKANLLLIASTTIDQATNTALGGVSSRTRPDRLKTASQTDINDVMKALTDYAIAEEEVRFFILKPSCLSFD